MDEEDKALPSFVIVLVICVFLIAVIINGNDDNFLVINILL